VKLACGPYYGAGIYSSVSIVTSLQRSSSWIPSRGKRFFSSSEHSYQLITPPNLNVRLIPGALSLGVKRPGLETSHSCMFSAYVKNVWKYTSVLLSAFMACTAITAHALFVLISCRVYRVFTSALDGQINSVPLLKNVNLFWALVIMSLLQLQCATVFLFWWLCQHKGLLWRFNKNAPVGYWGGFKPPPEIPKISVESLIAWAGRIGVSISFCSSLCSRMIVIY